MPLALTHTSNLTEKQYQLLQNSLLFLLTSASVLSSQKHVRRYCAALPEMPTHYGCGVKVRLRMSPLPESTNSHDQDNHTARLSFQDRTKSVQHALDKACLLSEESVPYHDDDRPPYFLDGDTTIPFFMVKVGRKLKDPKPCEGVSTKRSMSRSGITPHAAPLRETTMPPPFLPTAQSISGQKRKRGDSVAPVFDAVRQYEEILEHDNNVEQPGQNLAAEGSWTIQKALSLQVEFGMVQPFKRDVGKLLPIKTEVYINGELSNCGYYGLHQRTEKGMKPQRHSGLRTGRVSELPWVLMTRDAIDERQLEGAKGNGSKRWSDIAAALQLEADNCGRDSSGRRSPTGACLSILASMAMPNTIRTLTRRDSPSFGIIDVIVSRGKGAKNAPETGHLLKVQRMLDHRFKMHGLNGPKAGVMLPAANSDRAVSAIDDIMSDAMRLDGSNDPKTPSDSKKRHAVMRSSPVAPPDISSLGDDPTEGSRLGFLASAHSSDPRDWDIIEPHFHNLQPFTGFTSTLDPKNRAQLPPTSSSDSLTSSPSLTRDRSNARVVSNRYSQHELPAGVQNENGSLMVKSKTNELHVQHMNIASLPVLMSDSPLANAPSSGRVPRITLKFNPGTQAAAPLIHQAPPDMPPVFVAPPARMFTHRQSMSTTELSPLQRLARRPDADIDLRNMKPYLALAEGEEAARRMSALQNDSSPMKNRELTKEFKNAVLTQQVPRPRMPHSIVQKLIGASKEIENYPERVISGTVLDDLRGIPELSKGCILTYAHNSDGTGPQRQIKAERAGVFEEVDVLMAVRYLVGIGAGEE